MLSVISASIVTQLSPCWNSLTKKGEIFGENELAQHVYQVRRGAVRSYKLLSDGRRQIGAFHLTGDLFGLENGEWHRFTTEAVIKTTVRMIKRESLQAVAETDAVVARNLLSMTTSNLVHAEKSHAALGTQNRGGTSCCLYSGNG